jgi:hypothetical protein
VRLEIIRRNGAGELELARLRRLSGSSCTGFSRIAQIGANVTSYQDANRTRGRVYRYRVRAFNAAGNSAYSNIANAKAP